MPKSFKTNCPHGHEFTPENTIVNSKFGTRACRTCHNQRQHQAALRAKQQKAENGVRTPIYRKLTFQEIAQIRQRYLSHDYSSLQALATEYQVSRPTIDLLVLNKTYKDENYQALLNNKLEAQAGAHSNAKLSAAQVQEIRLALAAGESTAHLAKSYKISEATISLIKKGERWKNVDSATTS